MKAEKFNSIAGGASCALLVLLAFSAVGRASPVPKQIGPGLYAYISDNDGSANSTFLVGKDGILVVDTGVDAKEGGKLLTAIRSVSNLPVKYIVNTHYHPDHQGGNSVVGPAAVARHIFLDREAPTNCVSGLGDRANNSGRHGLHHDISNRCRLDRPGEARSA